MGLANKKLMLVGLLIVAGVLMLIFSPRGAEPLAYDLYEQGRYAEAADQFGKLLEANRSREYVWLQARSLFLAEDFTAWGEKMWDLSRSLLKPDDLDLVEEYAFYLYREGHWFAAMELWQRVERHGYPTRPQHRELMLTLVHGGYSLLFRGDPESGDPLMRYLALKHEFSMDLRRLSSHYLGRGGRTVEYASAQSVWLLEQSASNQLPEALEHPYGAYVASYPTTHWDEREMAIAPIRSQNFNGAWLTYPLGSGLVYDRESDGPLAARAWAVEEGFYQFDPNASPSYGMRMEIERFTIFV
ncbi:MAG: hypothetical protein FH749_15775 [Firmicutes bacterium]|nr:hypothetical protein [Bacillota bacterium]